MSVTTTDAFLDGRLEIIQPKQGYRAATDPVFMAAFVPLKPGESLLELGCGVGTASLCLGARVAHVALTGLEIQAQYAALARENALKNEIRLEVVEGDVLQMPAELRSRSFDQVMANPPFFEAEAHSASPVASKDTANRAADPLSWIACGLKRLKPGGWITLVQRSHHLANLLGELSERAGDITILPLSPRDGRPADRVLVRARKGSKGKLVLCAPLVIHEGTRHMDGPQGYTTRAQGVLRGGKAIEF